MIDFELNKFGDIKFAENSVNYPQLKISFQMSDSFPKLRINFHTKDRGLKNNGLKIMFGLKEEAPNNGIAYIPCVRTDSEKAQSISIRLKTELNELNRYYGNFGSELIRIRHKDLKTVGNHNVVKEYTSDAISDIIPIEKQDIKVERKIMPAGKLQLATLNINISEKPYTKLYEYEI